MKNRQLSPLFVFVCSLRKKISDSDAGLRLKNSDWSLRSASPSHSSASLYVQLSSWFSGLYIHSEQAYILLIADTGCCFLEFAPCRAQGGGQAWVGRDCLRCLWYVLHCKSNIQHPVWVIYGVIRRGSPGVLYKNWREGCRNLSE